MPGDLVFARRTVGAGPHDGDVPRHPVDANVQEAADEQPEQERKECFDHERTCW